MLLVVHKQLSQWSLMHKETLYILHLGLHTGWESLKKKKMIEEDSQEIQLCAENVGAILEVYVEKSLDLSPKQQHFMHRWLAVLKEFFKN